MSEAWEAAEKEETEKARSKKWGGRQQQQR